VREAQNLPLAAAAHAPAERLTRGNNTNSAPPTCPPPPIGQKVNAPKQTQPPPLHTHTHTHTCCTLNSCGGRHTNRWFFWILRRSGGLAVGLDQYQSRVYAYGVRVPAVPGCHALRARAAVRMRSWKRMQALLLSSLETCAPCRQPADSSSLSPSSGCCCLNWANSCACVPAGSFPPCCFLCVRVCVCACVCACVRACVCVCVCVCSARAIGLAAPGLRPPAPSSAPSSASAPCRECTRRCQRAWAPAWKRGEWGSIIMDQHHVGIRW
jgi:hypothetical protein